MIYIIYICVCINLNILVLESINTNDYNYTIYYKNYFVLALKTMRNLSFKQFTKTSKT